ncbi:MAG: SDR family NAD(P)-dependent oxidoreductase, partial [Oscillospiraceae bacterium]|nr:SDR family NAD(P)-dependent oxidoreductase [Oscillospiraceae bacterium]
MESLKGKTLFVTGGASGIGLGIAKAAAVEGANIFIADLRQSAIDESLAWFKENNYPAAGAKLDVSDRSAFKVAADAAEAKFGKIHILINNAGIGCASGPLWSVSAEDTDFALRINLVGVLNGIQEIVPRILKHGEEGYIVSTASKAGLIPVPGCGLYNLTKQAVVGISETLASDLKGTKVGAAVLCPGPFTTNLGKSGQEVEAELLGREIKPFLPPQPKDGEEPPKRPAPPADVDFTKIMRSIDEAGA